MSRVVALLLLIASAWFGIGDAYAGCSAGTGNVTCPTREEAYAYVQGTEAAAKAARCDPSMSWSFSVVLNGTNSYDGLYNCAGNVSAFWRASWPSGQDCPAGKTWDDTTHTCRANCTAGQTSSGTFRKSITPPSCGGVDACTTTWTPEGPPYVVVGSDGIPNTYQRWNGVTVGGPHCTQGTDTDGDGIPDSEDDFPSDPSENTDTDGDGIGDNNDAMPGDPDNGEDDGIGDESDNTSNGGGTCASPPVSSGDAIAAQIAYQTWATRCAIEKLNAATTGNGTGTAPGGGTGTDMTATNAKLDTINDKLSEGDSDMDEGHGTGTTADLWFEPEDTPSLNLGGFSLSRECPSPPSFSYMGITKTLDWGPMCTVADVIAAMVLVMAAAHAAYIFAGRNS